MFTDIFVPTSDPASRDSNWGYARVPIVGPAIGGVVAGLLAHALNYV